MYHDTRAGRPHRAGEQTREGGHAALSEHVTEGECPLDPVRVDGARTPGKLDDELQPAPAAHGGCVASGPLVFYHIIPVRGGTVSQIAVIPGN